MRQPDILCSVLHCSGSPQHRMGHIGSLSILLIKRTRHREGCANIPFLGGFISAQKQRIDPQTAASVVQAITRAEMNPHLKTPSPMGSESPKLPNSADLMRANMRVCPRMSFNALSQASNSPDRRIVYIGVVYSVGYAFVNSNHIRQA